MEKFTKSVEHRQVDEGAVNIVVVELSIIGHPSWDAIVINGICIVTKEDFGWW